MFLLVNRPLTLILKVHFAAVSLRQPSVTVKSDNLHKRLTAAPRCCVIALQGRCRLTCMYVFRSPRRVSERLAVPAASVTLAAVFQRRPEGSASHSHFKYLNK